MNEIFSFKGYSICEKNNLFYVFKGEEQISKPYRYLANAYKAFFAKYQNKST